MFFGLASGSRFAQLEHRPGGARTLDIVENTFEEQLASDQAARQRCRGTDAADVKLRQRGGRAAARPGRSRPAAPSRRHRPAPASASALTPRLCADCEQDARSRLPSAMSRSGTIAEGTTAAAGSTTGCSSCPAAAAGAAVDSRRPSGGDRGISGVRVDDLGVSTRKVDELVKTLGLDGISKSQVSRCERALRSAIPRRCWTRSVSDDPPACGGLAGSCARPRGRRRTRGSVIASQPRRSGRSSAVGRRPDGGDRVRGARRGVVAPRWGTAGPKGQGREADDGNENNKDRKKHEGQHEEEEGHGHEGNEAHQVRRSPRRQWSRWLGASSCAWAHQATTRR